LILLILQTPKPLLRAKDFPFKAEGKVIREFKALHFEEWLGYNQKVSSTEATVKQFAEFVTFSKARHKSYVGFVHIVIFCIILV
jgi:hypothetical protein